MSKKVQLGTNVVSCFSTSDGTIRQRVQCRPVNIVSAFELAFDIWGEHPPMFQHQHFHRCQCTHQTTHPPDTNVDLKSLKCVYLYIPSFQTINLQTNFGIKQIPRHMKCWSVHSIFCNSKEHHKIIYLQAVADKIFCDTDAKALPPFGRKMAEVKKRRDARSGTPQMS